MSSRVSAQLLFLPRRRGLCCGCLDRRWGSLGSERRIERFCAETDEQLSAV